MLENIPCINSSATFQCETCGKVYLTKTGLTGHINAKHKDQKDTSDDQEKENKSSSKIKSTEEILHPLYFKTFVNDGCYPDDVVSQLNQNTVGKLDQINHTYSFIKQTITSCNGDVEIFYQSSYKCVSDADNLFQGLSKNCSLLLDFEVDNQVLSFFWLGQVMTRISYMSILQMVLNFQRNKNQSFSILVVMFLELCTVVYVFQNY